MKLICRVEINKDGFTSSEHELCKCVEVREVCFVKKKYIASGPTDFKIIIGGKELDITTVWIVINLFCTYVVMRLI